jgi:hypothetical protein
MWWRGAAAGGEPEGRRRAGEVACTRGWWPEASGKAASGAADGGQQIRVRKE